MLAFFNLIIPYKKIYCMIVCTLTHLTQNSEQELPFFHRKGFRRYDDLDLTAYINGSFNKKFVDEILKSK